jgi:Uncharacterized protein conserved in bacteria (DUF2188)
MSALTQFIVLKRGGRWSVKSKDLERVFSTQREAIEAAVQLANDCGKNGKSSVVLFQRSKTRFENIWTYGKSPYPPGKSDLRIALQHANSETEVQAKKQAPSRPPTSHPEGNEPAA